MNCLEAKLQLYKHAWTGMFLLYFREEKVNTFEHAAKEYASTGIYQHVM